MNTTLIVRGMHCHSCEMLIKDTLEDIDGVSCVSADHEKGTVELDHDPSVAVLKDIKDTIRSEGYEVD